MTAITLVSPLAPQPALATGPETFNPGLVQALPASDTSNMSKDAGTASDQSGQGAGNGAGTGGAQVAIMLKRARAAINPQDATRQSVVEAQAEAEKPTADAPPPQMERASGDAQADLTAAFLQRQERQRVEARAAEEARAADVAMARAEAAQQAAEEAAQPQYVMPNPLPTAPILQSD
ncbi:MAG: hypothetical protein AB8B58_18765 [Roseobacter sp.]